MVLFIFGFTLGNADEIRRVLSSFETSKCMWRATRRTFVLSDLACVFLLHFQQFLLIRKFPAMDAYVHHTANENSHREGRRPWPCELVETVKFAGLKA